MNQEQKPGIHSIFIGQPKTLTDEHGTWRSSIYRERVDGPVQAQVDGLVGDKVAQPYHGGPDSAICVHLLDHYLFWNEHHDLNLKPGYVGENFTLDRVTEDQICAGDIVRVGTTLVQVSGPRVPCANQARRIGRANWVKLTIMENRTGFYLRVLEPGTIQPGAEWNLQERPNPDGSIPALNRCMYLSFDLSYAQRIGQMQGLGEWWKEQVRQKQEQLHKHWTASMKD